MISHDVDLDGSWSVGTRPHGGYLLATMVAAALDDKHPHPMAVSAHYVSSPDAAPALVEVEQLRSGRSVTSTRLRLSQSGTIRVEALLTSGLLTASSAVWAAPSAAPPVLPDPDDCPRVPAVRPDGSRVGQLEHVDLRPDVATAGWVVGRPPSGRAQVHAWLRRDDGADPSLLDLLIFADALPPVTFDLGLMGWVPTIELTVLVRALPAPGWVRAVQRTRLLQDGWLDEECDLWDGDGRLVVQARQLAGYRAPQGWSPPAGSGA